MIQMPEVPNSSSRKPASRGVVLLASGLAVGAALWFGSLHLLTRGDVRSTAIAQNVSLSARPAGTANFADIVDRVKPAVIGIRAEVEEERTGQLPPALSERFHQFEAPKADKSDGKPERRPRVAASLGSGFFISADGYAVTTNHLVERVKSIEVTTDDGASHPATLVGTDPKTDLALLKVEGVDKVPFVQLSNRVPRIGEWVLAVGNPFGLGGTVTAGIVSARARDIKLGTFNDFIQIDAPVNQGNSGGPTFDIDGNVIGVNSAIFSPTGSSVGIGFAIPSETVRAVVAQLKNGGTVVRGRVGLQVQTITSEIAEALGLDRPQGALVVEPETGSPAAKAGIQSGDVITAINGAPAKTDHDLMRKIGDMTPGTTVTLTVRRKGEDQTFTVTLDELPSSDRKAASADADPKASNAPVDVGLTLAPAPAEAGQGVIVMEVDPDGTAADRLEIGDVIVDVSGQAVKTPVEVERLLNIAQKEGKRLAVIRVKTGTALRFITLPIS
jgi:serine protease Do